MSRGRYAVHSYAFASDAATSGQPMTTATTKAKPTAKVVTLADAALPTGSHDRALTAGAPARPMLLKPQESFKVAIQRGKEAGETATLLEGFERVRLAHGGASTPGWREDAFARGFLSEVDPSVRIPTPQAAMLFRAFDLDKDGLISADEFMYAMTVVRHGSERERLLLLYSGIAQETTAASFNALARALHHAGRPAPRATLETWLVIALPDLGYPRASYEYSVNYALQTDEAFAATAAHASATPWRTALLSMLASLDPMKPLAEMEAASGRLLRSPTMLKMPSRMLTDVAKDDQASALYRALQQHSTSGALDRAGFVTNFARHLPSRAGKPARDVANKLFKAVAAGKVCKLGEFRAAFGSVLVADGTGNGDDLMPRRSDTSNATRGSHMDEDEAVGASRQPGCFSCGGGRRQRARQRSLAWPMEAAVMPPTPTPGGTALMALAKKVGVETADLADAIEWLAYIEFKVASPSAAVQARMIWRHHRAYVARSAVVGDEWIILDYEWLAAWQHHIGADSLVIDLTSTGSPMSATTGANTAATSASVAAPGSAGAGSPINGSPARKRASFAAHRPQGLGEIDNTRLLLPDRLRLRADICHKADFEIVAPKVFTALSAWYGCTVPVRRTVGLSTPYAIVGTDETQKELELYPAFSNMYLAGDSAGAAGRVQGTLVCSRWETVAQVKVRACQALGVDEALVRMWLRDDAGTGDGENLSVTSADGMAWQDGFVLANAHPERLIDAILGPSSLLSILVEEAAPDGGWPRGDGAASGLESSLDAPPPGIGLSNLGNTCFMAATLQALGHVAPWRAYFVSGEYAYDLNTASAFGMQVLSHVLNHLPRSSLSERPAFASRIRQGKLAVAYGSLLQEMAQTQAERRARSVAPSTFKHTVGRFNPTFAGYMQQDASEFLAMLLEGLSEDLNHVATKPYVEMPESGGRTDWVVADETWQNHLKREQHLVTALLTGSMHSEMVCAASGERSVTFEPFSFLVVPLPEDLTVYVNVRIHFAHQRLWPVHAMVCVSSDGSVADVLTEAASLRFAADTIVNDDETHLDGPPPAAEDLVAALGGGMTPTILERTYPIAHLRNDETLLIYELVAPATKAVQASATTATAAAVGAAATVAATAVAKVVTRPAPMVLTCHLRTLLPVEDYFINPYRPQLFGSPFLVRVQSGATTCHGLYEHVWKQIRPYFTSVPEGSGDFPFELHAQRSVAGAAATPSGAPDEAITADVLIGNTSATLELGPVLGLMVDVAVAARKHFDDNLHTFSLEHESVARLRPAALGGRPSELNACMATLAAPEEVVKYSKVLTQKNDGEFTEGAWMKTTKLWQPPPVLVLVLKRFRVHERSGQRYKLGNHVNFPVDDADFSASVVPPAADEPKGEKRQRALYDLSAVVNHHGGLRGGHYTCYARGLDGNAPWLCLDDSSVRPIDPKKVVSHDAYILFYTRKDAGALDVDALRKELFPRGSSTPADLAAFRTPSRSNSLLSDIAHGHRVDHTSSVSAQSAPTVARVVPTGGAEVIGVDAIGGGGLVDHHDAQFQRTKDGTAVNEAMTLDPKAVAKERFKAEKRAKELKKRQAQAGKLTPMDQQKEETELKQLEGRIAILDEVVKRAKGPKSGAQTKKKKGAHAEVKDKQDPWTAVL